MLKISIIDSTYIALLFWVLFTLPYCPLTYIISIHLAMCLVRFYTSSVTCRYILRHEQSIVSFAWKIMRVNPYVQFFVLCYI